MMYGYDKTVHGTTHLDVEVDREGNTVSVWFRCCALPFKVTKVSDQRAEEMKRMSEEINSHAKLLAVDFESGDRDA